MTYSLIKEIITFLILVKHEFLPKYFFSIENYKSNIKYQLREISLVCDYWYKLRQNWLFKLFAFKYPLVEYTQSNTLNKSNSISYSGTIFRCSILIYFSFLLLTQVFT